MFRSHLSLSNTTVLKKKGTFFIDITMAVSDRMLIRSKIGPEMIDK